MLYGTGRRPTDATLVDADLDGVTDVMLVNSLSPSLSTVRGNGDRGLDAPRHFATGAEPTETSHRCPESRRFTTTLVCFNTGGFFGDPASFTAFLGSPTGLGAPITTGAPRNRRNRPVDR